MNSEISLYIILPRGIEYSQLYKFTSDVLKESSFDFKVIYKEEIDLASVVFAKLVSDRVELLIYDDGHLMRVDGNLESAIVLLTELDKIIKPDSTFFISGSRNKGKFTFPRGSSTLEIAQLLTNI